MIQTLLQLSFDAKLTLLLLVGSTLLCLCTGGVGCCASSIQRMTARVKLPPITLHPGCSFPGRVDQIYTLIFILYYVALTLIEYIQQTAESSSRTFDLSWWGVIFNLIIYLPMLLRYICLPAWERPKLSLGRVLAWVVGALALIYAASILLTLSGFNGWLLHLTGAPEYQPVAEALRTCDTGTRIRILVSAIVLAPIVEECCFRGFLYSILRRWSGFFAAMASSSLLFGAIHTSLMQFLPLTIFAMVQCWVYERTRTLWLPILIHCLFNALGSLALLYMEDLQRLTY